MSFIKTAVAAFAFGAVYAIGFHAGEAVWDAGLDDIVEEKTKKLFNRKNEEELY